MTNRASRGSKAGALAKLGMLLTALCLALSTGALAQESQSEAKPAKPAQQASATAPKGLEELLALEDEIAAQHDELENTGFRQEPLPTSETPGYTPPE